VLGVVSSINLAPQDFQFWVAKINPRKGTLMADQGAPPMRRRSWLNG
jgi:hypothetical protein